MAREDELIVVSVTITRRVAARVLAIAMEIDVPVASLYSQWIALMAIEVEAQIATKKRDRIKAGRATRP